MKTWALAVVLLLGMGAAVRSCAQTSARDLSKRSFPLPAAQPAGVPNGADLTDLSGQQQPDRPFTISRVFARGEIAAYAEAQVDGQAVPSQCDVKTRWEDGSLKHALISFRAGLPANGKTRVEFANSAAPCSLGSVERCEAAALDREGMLSFANRGWDAAIETQAGGVTQTVSARSMIEAGAFRYWLKGPIVTQVIVEDRTPATSFDFGFQDDATAAVATPHVGPADTSFELVDASALAGLAMPATIRAWGETIQVCRVEGNKVSIGRSACPAADGRAVEGGSAAHFYRGDVIRIPALERPDSWHERAIGFLAPLYNASYAANLTSLPTSGGDLFTHLSVPFTIQIEDEQMSVCRVDVHTLRLGQSTSNCPSADGRGINGTRAAPHLDITPIYSPSWGTAWKPAATSRFRSLHPIFVQTFYAGLNAVKVEAILENVWFSRAQDQHYRVALKSGPGLGHTVYQAVVPHFAFARWHRTFWSGDEPGKAAIDHNFAYLMASRVLPYWDPSYKVTGTAVKAALARYARSAPDLLLRTGTYAATMGEAGGRPELGLFSGWDVLYLYTGDQGLLNLVLDNAAAAANAPIHVREDDPARMFPQGSSAAAFGHPVSDDSRPALHAWRLTSGADAMTPVGFASALPRNSGSAGNSRHVTYWSVDISHQPSMAFLPYLLTGDWYYLEELYFWSAYNVLAGEPGDCGWCRGNELGYINEAGVGTRGLAWALRNLGHALFSAPDDAPEKTYLGRKLLFNLAVREGVTDIRDGYFYDRAPDSPWQWGRRVVANNLSNPLHFPNRVLGTYDAPAGSKAFCYGDADWMINYSIPVLGHLEELGLTAVGPLRQATGRLLLNQILNPDFAPKALMAIYIIPVTAYVEGCPVDAKVPFDNWKQIAEAISDANRESAEAYFAKGIVDTVHGYNTIAFGASAFLGGISENGLLGEDAYAWMKANVKNQQAFNADPKWAFAARPPAGTAALPGRSDTPAKRIRKESK